MRLKEAVRIMRGLLAEGTPDLSNIAWKKQRGGGYRAEVGEFVIEVLEFSTIWRIRVFTGNPRYRHSVIKDTSRDKATTSIKDAQEVGEKILKQHLASKSPA